MNEDEISAQEFYAAVLYRRLLYLKFISLLGYEVDDKEIWELELIAYPELKELEIAHASSLNLRDLDELRLLLSIVHLPYGKSNDSTKALIIRLGNTILRMRAEYNHQRPHFHIEYKQEHIASYAIDNLERLAGNMPAKYEKPILKWASQHQDLLNRTWKKLKKGEDIQELLLEAQTYET